ncbi:MarR family transcriptional regulator [Undibacterium sp. Ji42W]|uniref:MarR family transcriptional regulator n=1 Tax=Undibacterium sp. Ji42W TaxID=3413039 RepID=UPI003BF212F1
MTNLTQQQIAEHLDLSQAEVSKFLKQAEIDWRECNLDYIRVQYIRKLRGNAAGHRTEDGDDLVRERVLTERIDRELKQFTLAEKKGQLVNVAQLEPELMQMIGAFKSELLSRDDKLKAALDALHGIDVDIQFLNDYTYAAFNHLARYDPGSAPDVVAPGEGDDTTGTDHH